MTMSDEKLKIMVGRRQELVAKLDSIAKALFSEDLAAVFTGDGYVIIDWGPGTSQSQRFEGVDAMSKAFEWVTGQIQQRVKKIAVEQKALESAAVSLREAMVLVRSWQGEVPS